MRGEEADEGGEKESVKMESFSISPSSSSRKRLDREERSRREAGGGKREEKTVQVKLMQHQVVGMRCEGATGANHRRQTSSLPLIPHLFIVSLLDSSETSLSPFSLPRNLFLLLDFPATERHITPFAPSFLSQDCDFK